MDKDKLIAARKKLKEYQRNKRENIQEFNNTSHQNNCQQRPNEKVPNEIKINDLQITTSFTNANPIEANAELNTFDNLFNTGETYKINNTALSPQQNGLQIQNEVSDSIEKQDDCNFNKKVFLNNDSQEVVNNTKIEDDPNKDIKPHYEYNTDSQSENEKMSSDFTSVEDSFLLQKQQISQMTNAVMEVLNDAAVDHTKSLKQGLEYEGIFIGNYEDQNELVNQLHEQLNQDKMRISELETLLSTKDNEWKEKLECKMMSLKEQLQIHAHTTSILVSEKAELSGMFKQSEAVVQQQLAEIEDLSDKLKHCQLRISELEKDLLLVTNNNNDIRKALQQLQDNYDDITNKFFELRKEKEDMEQECSELRQNLNQKNAKIINLEQELEKKKALLSLSELQMQQLMNSPHETKTLPNYQTASTVHEQQIIQLKEEVKSLNEEKDEANKQYKLYIQELDKRHMEVINELESTRQRLIEFESREESYIQRLSDLEQQLQQEKGKSESLIHVQDHQDRIDVLIRNIDNLVLQQESLQSVLNSKDAEIEQLKEELQGVQELKQQKLDTSKLVSALESEQLGAARAVSQNQQLKNQLNEMHDAFVSLSNSKLDLTEQLQAERSIGKKLNAMLSKLEIELDDVKNQLVAKEAALVKLEKEKLQAAEVVDHMHHCQTQSHDVSIVQQELAEALKEMECLRKDNQRLQDKINTQSKIIINLQGLSNNKKVNDATVQETNHEKTENITNNNGGDNTRKTSIHTQTLFPTEEDETFTIPEPLKKLEAKFKSTMEQIAELTDEKQRLEHLVLQLQGETETIGEYITLYQNQRSILQNRAKERENTFRQLIEQRNYQQEQLHKLKVLVADLIKNKKNSLSNVVSPPGDENCQSRLEENHLVHENNDKANTSMTIDPDDKMTSQILDLLTQIKDCNDMCTTEPDFHPCPWCSGKLITV